MHSRFQLSGITPEKNTKKKKKKRLTKNGNLAEDVATKAPK